MGDGCRMDGSTDTTFPGRGTPLGFFVSVHSAGVEVLCFDTLLQVFILRGLARDFVV